MQTSPQTVESSFRWSLLAIVFVVVSAGLMMTVYAYYQHQAEHIRSGALTQLTSVAQMRVGELVQWQRERLGDARFYQGNEDFVHLVATTIRQPEHADASTKLSEWISQTQESHDYDIVLLDDTGRIRHASDPGKLPARPVLDTVIADRTARLLDFYLPRDGTDPRLAMVVPLADPDNPSAPLATMLWLLDPRDYLYPLLDHWPLQSRTATSCLLRREQDRVLCLTSHKDHPAEALRHGLALTEAGSAEVQAAIGVPSPIQGHDFSGRPVTAVAKDIPGTPWILMVSLATAEIEGPLHQRLRELLVTSFALLAAAGAAIAYIWRGQSAHFLRERLAHAEALSETQKRFRLLFNAVPDAVMLLEAPGSDGKPGRFIEVNDVACQRLGYTREELTKLTPFDIDSPSALADARLHAERLITEGADTWEGEHLAKDGRIIPVEINARVIELENRRLWLAISRDISERRDTRDQLARLNRALAVSNGINQAILRERDQRTLLTRACEIAVDRGGFRMVWIGLLSADGTHIEPAVHAGHLGDYLTGVTIRLSAPLETAGPASVSVRNRAPAIRNDVRRHAGVPWADSALRLGYNSCASFPLIVAGEPRGMVALYANETGVFADDEVNLLEDMADNLGLAMELSEHETLRRQAEEALKTSEQRFRTILENMPGIAVQGYDRERRVIFWNQSSVELYGWSAAEALGRRPEELIVPAAQAAEAKVTVDAWLRGGPPMVPGEFTLLRKDGSTVNVFSGFFLFKNERNEPEIFSLDIDLTARNAAQAELHLLHAALEATPTSWVITNAEGIIQWVNPAFTALTGYPPEEALGRTPHLLYSGHQADSFYENLWATIRGGKIWSGELRNRRRDGSLYHEHMTVAPVRDVSGNITHFVAMKQDITEQKKLEHQLLRAQRMEGIGLLAGGIAHDLNNVLAPILLSVELLRLRFPGPENKSSLDVIETSARRGAGVVRQVLTFARGIDGERISLRPKDLLREITFIAEETFPRTISVIRNVDDNLPCVLGDPTQLHQILLNLAVNARDAMPAGGTLTLEAIVVEVDAAKARETGNLQPGSYVRLGVEDTGIGIPADHLDKIFEPFFTTKGVGQGTGLGLSAVFGIVRSHGGFVEVHSEVGKGSRFYVHLPALPALQAAVAGTNHPFLVNGRGRGVLVCDDEEAIRFISATVLGKHGFKVFTAADGEEARLLHAQHRDEIHLALLDIMLPTETGDRISLSLREVTPGLPVLFSTGMIGDAAAENILREQLRQPHTALLAKPYDEHTLVTNIARLLDHPDRLRPV